MTFRVCFFVWFCGLTLAQDGLSETEGAETKACFPDMCELLEEFGAMKVKQETMETRLVETENQVLELKNKGRTVAFSAATTGRGDVGPYSTESTIVYNTVITNVGNAYNQQTGIFVAPVAGMYYFTFFYHAGGHVPTGLVLVKNNHYIISTTDHQTSYDGADNGGNAAFLQLQQGDQVSIRLYANCQVWGGNYRTTFSGVLLYPL
uniref:C1q domain-containing protein n=1 Tax=Cyprinodon variegatus TaxID=28743 RepID=A0A3Q2CQT1_CYPVA